MHPEQKRILKAMTPSEKLKAAMGLYHSARELKAAGLRHQHPDWTERRIFRQPGRNVASLGSDSGVAFILLEFSNDFRWLYDMNNLPELEIRYRVLTLLSKGGRFSQREMAGQIGISLGKMNHFLSEWSREGLILVQRGSTDGNRLHYLYLLTPAGLEEKAALALSFLKTKIREYEKVKRQIRELAKEVGHEKVPADLEGEGREAV